MVFIGELWVELCVDICICVIMNSATSVGVCLGGGFYRLVYVITFFSGWGVGGVFVVLVNF